jgi:hypothetical protein
MQSSGITEEIAIKCGLKLSIDDQGAHFTIPYFNIDLVQTTHSRQRNREEQVVREEGVSGGNFRGKYTQKKGSKNHVYFPPIFPQRVFFNNPECPLLVCEGELKSIAAQKAICGNGTPMLIVGVPGTKLCATVREELLAINCIGSGNQRRVVYLCTDWNGAGQARERAADLEYELKKLFQGLGAKVVVLRWALPEHGQKTEQKLDDWLVAGGDISAAMRESEEEIARVDSELSTLWDYFNANYCIMHGFYIPLNNLAQKYTVTAFRIMEPSKRLQISAKKFLHPDDVWALQPPDQRNVCDGYVFKPSPLGLPVDQYVWEEGKRMLNTAPEWGWESPPWVESPPEVGPFLALIERLCQDNGDWYIDFLAQIAQQPTVRGHHIVMFQDEGNTGKDRLFDTLSQVFQGYCGPVGTSLTSSFNANMEHLLLPFWSDPVVNGRGGLDRALESMLKNYSGTTYQEINHKGGAKYSVRNYGRLHIAMNLDWLVKIAAAERRYAVFGGLQPMPHEWAVEYMTWLSRGGVDSIRQLLVQRDISSFDVMAPAPRTKKRIEMEQSSRHPLESFLADEEWVGYKDIWGITELCDLYKLMCGHHVSPETMGKAIRKHHESYAHDKLIKTGGRPLRMAAIRRGQEWKKRMEVDGNGVWTAEYSKKRTDEGEPNTKF